MSLLIRALIPALSLFLLPLGISAQIAEEEPNNPCSAAQFLGDPGLPFSVIGSLDSLPEAPDVDFYRVAGVPGQFIRIDLEGAVTNMGDLTDPYLGFFDSACNLLAVNDDSGTLNSRLTVAVPDDGIYVLGATNCCDSEFLGGGVGSYTLTVSEPVLLGSIAGRAVDGETLLPLPGDAPPFAWVELRSCDDFGCFISVNSQAAGSDGRFLFTTDYNGSPLSAGTYEIGVFANLYSPATFGPFEVADDQDIDVGDVPVMPVELIGAVSGRLVDALDGSPLPGDSPPFAWVQLERCEDWGCFPVAGTPTDTQGFFRIEGSAYFLSPGTYRILGQADDYYPLPGEPFFVGDGEDVDLGELPLTPLPILFGEITGCDVLPLGGVCDFSVNITHRGPGRYRGEAWAIVRYFSVEYPNLATRFQIGRMGSQNPNPQRVNLAEGKQTTLGFKLAIPASAPEGTYMCVSANVGRDPAPQFDAAGDRLLFCATTQADGMRRLSGKESQRQLRQLEKSTH